MPIKTLRAPDDRFNELPDWPMFHVISINFLMMKAYGCIDESVIQATFLCIHRKPTWPYLSRKMAPMFLFARHRFVAMGMFGFGGSDKLVDDEIYINHFHRNALVRNCPAPMKIPEMGHFVQQAIAEAALARFTVG